MTKFTKALSVIITLWLLLFLINPAFAQGGNLGSVSSPVTNRNGQPISGVNISFCQPLGVASAAVTSNVAILTMSSNPVTAGFVSGMTILVNGFTGGDTYFNGGILSNGVISGGYTILSVTATTITYSLAHANAASGTVGAVLQQGNTTTSCAGRSTVYSNPTLATTTTNPITSDNQGNWNVFAAPGLYYVQFYGTGITTTLKQIAIACVPTGTCTTLSPLVIPGITSGGLSVTSPAVGGSAAIQIGVAGNGTAVPTFPAATDTVVELTQNQTMTNKGLTAPAISNAAMSGTTTYTGPIAGLCAATATSTTNFTTASAVFVDITGLSVTCTSRGGKLLVIATFPATTAASDGVFTLSADAVDGSNLGYVSTTAVNGNTVVLQTLYSPSAGSHTYKARAKNPGAGTITDNMSGIYAGTISVIEVSQ